MDLGGLGEMVTPVDTGNLVQGGSTLGFPELIKFFDEHIEVSDAQGLTNLLRRFGRCWRWTQDWA